MREIADTTDASQRHARSTVQTMATGCARAALDQARQQHLLALQRGVAGGLSSQEVLTDVGAFASAAEQLVGRREAS